MAKKKLQRFEEMKTFRLAVQPNMETTVSQQFMYRGKWNSHFFGRNAPLVLELGCGKGEYTLGLARRYPEKNYIGVDVKGARLWRGCKTATDEKMSNVAFLRTRIEFIHYLFAPNEVDEIWITFPDPQPKKTNKRLTSAHFLQNYQKICKKNALVHLKTDSQLLYGYTKQLLHENQIEPLKDFSDVYEQTSDELLHIQTFYEKKFLEKSKKITYLQFRLSQETKLNEIANEDIFLRKGISVNTADS